MHEEWRLLKEEWYRGPLPRPQDLAAYDDVYAGLAREIVGMARAEQGHRQKMEELEVRQPYKLATRGQWFGIIALIVMTGLAAYMVYRGQPEWATGIAGLEIAGVVGVFVTGQYSSKSETEGSSDESESTPPSLPPGQDGTS